MLQRLRLGIALVVAQASAKLIRLLGKGSATTVPGRLALRICPTLLPQLVATHAAANLPSLLVTGTNGKTTTASLAASLLQIQHPKVLHNHLGANMLSGIATTFALHTPWWQGQLAPQAKVIECDEAYVRPAMAALPFNAMIVTNLFRDQLDRYGELNATANLIAGGLPHLNGTLMLNADDPLVAQLKSHPNAKLQQDTLYFGLGASTLPNYPSSDHPVAFPQELSTCPTCNTPLVYSQRLLAHLGHYRCPHGHFQRPKPHVEALILEQTPLQSRLLITAPYFSNTPFELTVPLSGIYNLYNVLGAITVALKNGVQPNGIQQALLGYNPTFGRAERLFVKGKPLTLLLIKNPAGATEVLHLVGQDANARLAVLLNDNDADGRDVSWIWDTAFEDLIQHAVLPSKPLFVGGTRSADMANRLHYAGFDPQQLKTYPDAKSLLEAALADLAPNETLYVLPTYTALLQLRPLWASL